MILDLFNESTLFDDDMVEESVLDEVEAVPLKESEDLTDAYYRITLENVQNFNNIFNTIATNEMRSMEKNSGEVFYEGVDVKKIGSTIVEAVKSAWAKLKGLFEKAITAIMSLSEKGLLKSYENAIRDKKLSAGVIVQVKRGVKPDADIASIPGKVDGIISSIMADYMQDGDNITKDQAKNAVQKWNSEKAKAMGKMRGEVVSLFGASVSTCDAKEFQTKISEAAEKKFTEENIKITIGAAYNRLKTTAKVKDVRKAFKESQKSFNSLLKEAKKIQKNGEKADDTKVAEVYATLGALNANIIRDSITILNASAHQVIKIASKQAQMDRAVLKKALAGKTAGHAYQKPEEKKEDEKEEAPKSTDNGYYASKPDAESIWKSNKKANKKAKKSTNESADLICDLI